MDLLSAHGVERVAIVLDCCYAGRAISGFKGSASEQIKGVLDDGRGIFILGASGATQTAEEREADGNGIFTKQIIDGLRTGAADIDGDGDISLNDLAAYVKDELRREKGSTRARGWKLRKVRQVDFRYELSIEAQKPFGVNSI